MLKNNNSAYKIELKKLLPTIKVVFQPKIEPVQEKPVLEVVNEEVQSQELNTK